MNRHFVSLFSRHPTTIFCFYAGCCWLFSRHQSHRPQKRRKFGVGFEKEFSQKQNKINDALPYLPCELPLKETEKHRSLGVRATSLAFEAINNQILALLLAKKVEVQLTFLHSTMKADSAGVEGKARRNDYYQCGGVWAFLLHGPHNNKAKPKKAPFQRKRATARQRSGNRSAFISGTLTTTRSRMPLADWIDCQEESV